jgi:multicomponent Na+:H+ antiporter subunit C
VFHFISGRLIWRNHKEKPRQDSGFTFLFFAMVGYIDGGVAPIVDPADPVKVYVDPLPQALVLTAIVIGLATTSMLMAVIIRLYRKYGTFDIREIKNLRG